MRRIYCLTVAGVIYRASCICIVGSLWTHRSHRDSDNSGMEYARFVDLGRFTLFSSTERVLFRTTSSSLDCLSSASGDAHEKTEPMDSLESVSAVHSRTVSGNTYVRIATSPIEADDQKAPAIQEMDTTGFADSFVRTPIVVPVNLAVVVS